MTFFDNISASQKIHAALHRDVRAICMETCHFLGLEISKPAMEIIAELLYKKIKLYGTDLEAFAKHAKRTTVVADDVKLLVRRCSSLKNHITTLIPNTTGPKEKRRKTVASKMPETPSNRTPSKKPDSSTPTTKSPIFMAQSPKRKKPETPFQEKVNDEEIDKMVVDEIDLTFD